MVRLWYQPLYPQAMKSRNLMQEHLSTTAEGFLSKSSWNVSSSYSSSKQQTTCSGMMTYTIQYLLHSFCGWWVSWIKVINLRGPSTRIKTFVPACGKLVCVSICRRKVSKAHSTVGFMKHLPNLLKQESSSAATLVHVLLRMYHDTRPEHQAARPQIAERLVPWVKHANYQSLGPVLSFHYRLGVGVLRDFNKLKADSQSKNITAWTPVVAEILDGFCRFDRQDASLTIFALNTY